MKFSNEKGNENDIFNNFLYSYLYSITEFMGYTAEGMIGKSLFDFYHACDGEGIARAFKSCKYLSI